MRWKFVYDQIILMTVLSKFTIAVLVVQLSEVERWSPLYAFVTYGGKNSIVYRTETQELVEGRCSIKLYLQVIGGSPEILLGFVFCVL